MALLTFREAAVANSRLSCTGRRSFCIMGSEHDLRASSGCADNVAVYRERVELESRSSFSFQGSRWLGDVAPHLLDASLLARLQMAKERAAARQAAEACLPACLLFVKGWPTVMPSTAEARLIADVRRLVTDAVGLVVKYTHEAAVLARYAQLLSGAPSG